MCCEVPAPAEAKLSDPGFARASAISSLIEPAASEGVTSVTLGTSASGAIGANALTGS
jgi:hypothetical protein